MGYIDKFGYYLNSPDDYPMKPMCFGSLGRKRTDMDRARCRATCKFAIDCESFAYEREPNLEKVC